jgi:hypothetical protein
MSPYVDTLCRSGRDRGCRAVGELRLSQEKGLMGDPTTLSGTSPPSGSGRANSSRGSARPCRLLPDQPYEKCAFQAPLT